MWLVPSHASSHCSIISLLKEDCPDQCTQVSDLFCNITCKNLNELFGQPNKYFFFTLSIPSLLQLLCFLNLSLASVIFSNTAWFSSICSLSQWTQLVQSSPFCWTHLWFQLWPWTQVPWRLWSASSSLCETWTCLTLDSHLEFPALGLLCRLFWKP